MNSIAEILSVVLVVAGVAIGLNTVGIMLIVSQISKIMDDLSELDFEVGLISRDTEYSQEKIRGLQGQIDTLVEHKVLSMDDEDDMDDDFDDDWEDDYGWDDDEEDDDDGYNEASQPTSTLEKKEGDNGVRIDP